MAEPRTRSSSVSAPLPMLPRIIDVHTDPPDYVVVATFSTGEKRRYDVRPLLDRGVFRRIRDAQAFAAVAADEMGGLVWEAGPDLSRDTIYLGASRSDSGTSPGGHPWNPQTAWYSFEARCGEIGRHYVNVNHVPPSSAPGAKGRVDPNTDLGPSCPNCHVILHRTTRPLDVEHLREILNSIQQGAEPSAEERAG